MKKLISILLCLCLILSMALTAGAAEIKYVYVALGDEIATNEGLDGQRSYPELVAESIDAELVNLAEHGMTASALLEQVTSGEITKDLARANLITITCVVHDTIDLVFAKALTAYNEANDPDITSAELKEIIQSGNSDPRFMQLAMIALGAFNGNPSAGIPPYLESEEFQAALADAMALVDQVVAAIRAINPGAAILITNQYNPYASFSGLYSVVTQKLDQGLVKLNEALGQSGYNVVDLYSAFAASEENLCVASMSPKNMDFTPNAAGHAVIHELIMEAMPTLSPFVDVPTNQWFFDPVLWAVENGITQGVGDSKFAPNDPCTRGQVVTFLWRSAGSPEPTSTDIPFDDVTADKWFAKAVQWAVENGITQGVDKNKFAPNDPCTRAQVVTFLWRAEGKPEAGVASSFNDVPAGIWYADPVSWAVENAITVGVGEGQFAPNQTCNRAQIVTFLYRTENLK